MQSRYVYRPIFYFVSVYLLTLLMALVIVYMNLVHNWRIGKEWIPQLCMFLSMLTPCIVALAMIYGSRNTELIKDFWERLSLYKIKAKFVPGILLVMPCTLLLAIGIGWLLGYRETLFLSGTALQCSPLVFLSAAVFEELGWRGYGVDSLRAYLNLFITSLVFAFLWGYLQVDLIGWNSVYEHSKLQCVPVELPPDKRIYYGGVLAASFLINWVYYSNNRSIIVGILAHCMFSLCFFLAPITQMTRLIMVILLLILSGIIVLTDKKIFFSGPEKN